MVDSFTEITSQGWLSRLKDAIGGVLAGLALFVVSFPLLWWNEGRAVQTARSLEEGAGSVVSVAADKVDTANDGKLIHVTGMATTETTLTDQVFLVGAQALRLERKVEVYQWKEEVHETTEKKLGGGTETRKTYTYRKAWAGQHVDSARFKDPAGHHNPAPAVHGQTWGAQDVRLAAFALPDRLVSRISTFENLPVAPGAEKNVVAPFTGRARVLDGGFFVGPDPQNPQVGDLKVSFRVVKPTTVSVVAVQSGGTFAPYQAKAGDSVELLETGTHSADAMFKSAQEGNKMMTWLLRLLGYFLMAMGIYLVFRPLAVVADVLPLFGSMLALGAGVFAALLASVFSTVTIAVAWFFYRPLVTILVLVLSAVGAAMLAGMRHRTKTLARLRAPAG